MLISQILKMLMFKKNINTTQLAREINVPQQTLHRIVSGSSPNPHLKTLEPLSEFFSVSIDQLTGKKPLLGEFASARIVTAMLASLQQIPLLECLNVEYYLKDCNPTLIKDYIIVDGNVMDKAFAILMQDSSMEPYLQQGAILILDPIKIPKDRDFVLVNVCGYKSPVFRQLLMNGECSYLKPTNPDLATFPMRRLQETDKILGVLLEVRHRYNP